MKELTENSFETETKKGNVIVDFWAEWCGPCKMLGPVFEELSNEIKNVDFAKVNVDNNGELSGSAGVKGIPTLILYKDGKEIDRIVGALSKEALKQKIESTFS